METGLWELDQTASTVAVRHRTMWGLLTVKGTFTTVTGQGEVRPDGTADGTVTLDAASLETGNAKRDKHLRSADFFDTDRHPQIVFAVRGAERRDGDTVHVIGQLTVLGVASPLSFSARLVGADADALALDTEFTVDREQFGMGWNQLGMIRGLTTAATTLRFTRSSA